MGKYDALRKLQADVSVWRSAARQVAQERDNALLEKERVEAELAARQTRDDFGARAQGILEQNTKELDEQLDQHDRELAEKLADAQRGFNNSVSDLGQHFAQELSRKLDEYEQIANDACAAAAAASLSAQRVQADCAQELAAKTQECQELVARTERLCDSKIKARDPKNLAKKLGKAREQCKEQGRLALWMGQRLARYEGMSQTQVAWLNYQRARLAQFNQRGVEVTQGEELPLPAALLGLSQEEAENMAQQLAAVPGQIMAEEGELV
jgi:hypothetical protein